MQLENESATWFALTLPFASLTGYGPAKGGWVSAKFGPREKPPLGVLRAWIDESYRAVAPPKVSRRSTPPKLRNVRIVRGLNRGELSSGQIEPSSTIA
jgi:hypothetical protein